MNDWTQTPRTLTVNIPVFYKVDANKINYTITESYLKLNIPDQKIFKFFDFYSNIEIESSNVVVEDKQIIFYFNKVVEEDWPSLEYKGSKEEIRQRRQNAEDNYIKRVKEEQETATNKKKEFASYVQDQSFKIEDERRKELKEKKSQEKNTAEKELYDFIDKTNEKENKPINNNEEQITTHIDKISLTTKKTPELSNEQKITQVKRDNEIFDESNVKVTPNEQVNIRQSANITVNLTEKLIPHFAARESMTKEPPYPKSKKYVPEKNMVYIIYNY